MSGSEESSNSRKKSTLWNFLFLNVKFIISVVNGILIIPLYLYYIDSSIYGAWLATGSVLTWITVVDPGVGDVLLQKVAQCIGKDDKKEIGVAVTSGILISLGLFVLAMLSGYALSFFVGDIANISAEYRADIVGSFRIALWGTAFSLLADTFRNIALAYQKTKIHGFLLNLMMIISIIVNVVMLMLDFGVYALAYTSLFRGLSILTFALILTISVVRSNSLKLHFDLSYFKNFSKIFVYTFSSRLFETISSNIDLILVSRYLGPQEVTVLDLCRRPLKIVSGLSNNITISLLPSLPHLFGSGEKGKLQTVIMQIWTLILWSSGFIIGGFVLFNYSLTSNWVGKQFWIGAGNNVIMCISFFLLSIGYNLSNITYSMGDMKNNSLINILRSLLYLVLLYILSQRMGMTGVLISFAFPILIMLWYYPRKIFTAAELSTFHYKELLYETIVIVSFLAVCVAIFYTININLNWIYLVVGSVVYAIVYLCILLFTSVRFQGYFTSVRHHIMKKSYNKQH